METPTEPELPMGIVSANAADVNLDSVNTDNLWSAYDGFTLELGPEPDAMSRLWWARQSEADPDDDLARLDAILTAETADDDFPTPIAPTVRQRRPMPTFVGLTDEDIAIAHGGRALFAYGDDARLATAGQEADRRARQEAMRAADEQRALLVAERRALEAKIDREQWTACQIQAALVVILLSLATWLACL
jgi:hypothetical protein